MDYDDSPYVFTDIDNTITNVDITLATLKDFINLRKYILFPLYLLRKITSEKQWALHAYRYALIYFSLKGKKKDILENFFHEKFGREILINKKAIRFLKKYYKNGSKIIALTSSIYFLVKLLENYLKEIYSIKFYDIIATKLRIKDNKIMGIREFVYYTNKYKKAIEKYGQITYSSIYLTDSQEKKFKKPFKKVVYVEEL